MCRISRDWIQFGPVTTLAIWLYNKQWLWLSIYYFHVLTWVFLNISDNDLVAILWKLYSNYRALSYLFLFIDYSMYANLNHSISFGSALVVMVISSLFGKYLHAIYDMSSKLKRKHEMSSRQFFYQNISWLQAIYTLGIEFAIKWSDRAMIMIMMVV